ncbi:MAG: hypothetical protein ABIG95_03775 [Candidatus Woesearchaeota archaeon]
MKLPRFDKMRILALLCLFLILAISGCQNKELKPESEVESEYTLSAQLSDIENLEAELDFSELDTLEHELQNLTW